MEHGSAGAFPFSPALAEQIPVTLEDAMDETLMLGFRLTREGVRESAFRERFGMGLAERYAPRLSRLVQQGLVEWDSERARLTRRGRLLGNLVFREFV
jgi:oxygen-independent coproporphyrinogen-3 oxidase